MDALLRTLWARCDSCMLADQPRLRRLLRGQAAVADDAAQRSGLEAVAAEIDGSSRRRVERAAIRPRLLFPPDLPVSQRRDAIAEAIRDHQVVVVCGATGSGKTTQLPKICLELGRGVAGMIGHTQPRRIAARSVAARIAHELAGEPSAGSSREGSEVGGLVGCAIRFDDRTSPRTLVRVMTDGVLLAETQRDRLLRRYDTIIVDEAHERSLNIDFLLGYLHRILPRRPDLRIVVTSATIDPQRFANHFGGAPIVEVQGRAWPVEIRWRPLETDDPEESDRTLVEAILHAVDELAAQDRSEGKSLGDVLVFLSGEREIHEVADALRGRLRAGDEVVPLYARLSGAEQDRVFRAHSGRRVVLATNVAETSVTVPGIRHVVDSGMARISRQSSRSMVQRLPVEPISQASAAQRAGRCGRQEPGTCIRLYAESDHAARPAFTDPEILRTNLASVILRMKALRLGAVEEFPFPDRPSARAVAAGIETLHEVGAIDRTGELTEIGRHLARLPVDPRLGRMLMTALQDGGLPEVLVIVAVLATQDPRVRPADRPELADLAHARFRDANSDFLGALRIWDEWMRQRAAQRAGTIGSAALRRWCRDNSLSWMRLREWEETHRQLVDLICRIDVEGVPSRSSDSAPPRHGGATTRRGKSRRRRSGRRAGPAPGA